MGPLWHKEVFLDIGHNNSVHQAQAGPKETYRYLREMHRCVWTQQRVGGGRSGELENLYEGAQIPMGFASSSPKRKGGAGIGLQILLCVQRTVAKIPAPRAICLYNWLVFVVCVCMCGVYYMCIVCICSVCVFCGVLCVFVGCVYL